MQTGLRSGAWGFAKVTNALVPWCPPEKHRQSPTRPIDRPVTKRDLADAMHYLANATQQMIDRAAMNSVEYQQRMMERRPRYTAGTSQTMSRHEFNQYVLGEFIDDKLNG